MNDIPLSEAFTKQENEYARLDVTMPAPHFFSLQTSVAGGSFLPGWFPELIQDIQFFIRYIIFSLPRCKRNKHLFGPFIILYKTGNICCY